MLKQVIAEFHSTSTYVKAFQCLVKDDCMCLGIAKRTLSLDLA